MILAPTLTVLNQNALWSPLRLPGLAAWYDAADSSTVLTQVGGATNFVNANSQQLSVASNASLQTGDVDYTVCGWVNQTVALPQNVIGVWNLTGDQRQWRVNFNGSQLTFQVTESGTFASARTLSITQGAGWCFFCASHNAAANTISFSINNSAPITTSCSVGFTSLAGLFIGSTNGIAEHLDGSIDEITFHKRVLTADERTWLYNSGAGRTYAEAPDSLKTNLVSWWSMNAPATGDWLDQHGSNHLTPSASRPTATTGVTFNVAQDGQTVRRWLDKSGNGRHLDQATLANQPTFAAAFSSGGMPALRSLGTGSFQLTGLPSVGEETQYTVFSAAANNYVADGHTFATKGHWVSSNRSTAANTNSNIIFLASPPPTFSTSTTILGIVGIRFSVALGKQMYVGTQSPFLGVINESASPELTGVSNSTGITLFRHGSGSAGSDTNICEHFRCWGQVHDDATMLRVIRYLARKWNIAV
jgi:hypothetical protein